MSRDEYDTHDMSGERVSVHEAALRLGISDGAVRKRVERGSLEGDREDDGRLYVWLDAVADASHDGSHEGSRAASGEASGHEVGGGQDGAGVREVYEARIADLREQLEYFRSEMERRGEEAERKDRIIAGLAQSNAELASTVRALEPASQEPAAEPDEDTGTGEGASSEGASGEGSEDSHGQPYPETGNTPGAAAGGAHEGAVRGSGDPNSAAGSGGTKKGGGLLRLIADYLRK